MRNGRTGRYSTNTVSIGDPHTARHIRCRKRNRTADVCRIFLAVRICERSSGAARICVDLVRVLVEFESVLDRLISKNALELCRSFPAVTSLIRSQAEPISRIISSDSAAAAIDIRRCQSALNISSLDNWSNSPANQGCKVIYNQRVICLRSQRNRISLLLVDSEHEFANPVRSKG